MFNWNNIGPSTARQKCYADIRKLVTAANYGDGENGWTITELIKSRDSRKYFAFEVLEGRSAGRLIPNSGVKGDDGQPISFKLRVLSRQACKYDKAGNTIFTNEAGRHAVGGDNDIVAMPGDAPQPGDVVEIKGDKRRIDDDGNEIDSITRLDMEQAGEPIYDYIKFVVDSNLCITVTYPYVHSILNKAGKRIAMPEWAKSPKGRKLTNWLFEEVPADYKRPRKRKPLGVVDENQGSIPSA